MCYEFIHINTCNLQMGCVWKTKTYLFTPHPIPPPSLHSTVTLQTILPTGVEGLTNHTQWPLGDCRACVRVPALSLPPPESTLLPQLPSQHSRPATRCRSSPISVVSTNTTHHSVEHSRQLYKQHSQCVVITGTYGNVTLLPLSNSFLVTHLAPDGFAPAVPRSASVTPPPLGGMTCPQDH